MKRAHVLSAACLGIILCASNVSLIPLSRAVYDQSAPMRNGEGQKFQRPFFMEFIMFLSMTTCGILSFLRNVCRDKERQGSVQIDYIERDADYEERLALSVLNNNRHASPLPPPRYVRLVLGLTVPAACDFIGSWLIYSGALFTPASYVEMLLAAGPVFTALLSIVILKRRLTPDQWLGIVFVLLGAVIVSLARVYQDGGSAESTDPKNIFLGIILVLMSDLAYAMESVSSEVFLRSHGEVSTLTIIGIMGVWGLLYMTIAFPILATTKDTADITNNLWHENFLDTWHQVLNNRVLASLLGSTYFALVIFNVALFTLIRKTSALHLTILRMLVAPLVWCLDLVFGLWDCETVNGQHKCSNNAEAWMTPWSWIHLLGFLVLVLGTSIYHGVVVCLRGRSTSTSSHLDDDSLLLEKNRNGTTASEGEYGNNYVALST